MAGENGAAVDDSLPETSPAAASPSPAAPTPGAPPAAQPTPGAPPAAPAAPVAAVAGPTVVQPVKRGGLAGIVDEFRDAVAGTTSSKVYTDSDGNKYIKHPELTHGQQWLRIAATAAGGAAAGAAVGQGPGGAQRGAAAGLRFEQQQEDRQRQQEQDQSEEVKQAQLEKFNSVKLKHAIAANEFELQRAKVQATQSDITFSQGQIDREQKLGSSDLGVFKDVADLARVKEQAPEFWKHAYDNNIVAIPEFNDKGERTGIHLFMRTPGVGTQLVEPGTSIKVYQPGKGPDDPPTMVDQVPSVPMTQNQKDAYDNAAVTRVQQWTKDKAARDFQAAKTAHETASAAKEGADTIKAGADTAKAQAETAKIKGETSGKAPGDTALSGEAYLATIPSEQAALVRELHAGKFAPSRIDYLIGRGQGKDSKNILAALAQAYPGEVDTSKLSAYPAVYKEFTSTKGKTAGAAINQGGTALTHLNDLLELNTIMSHNPLSKDYTAYMDKAETVASELAQFYGNTALPAIAGIKKSLTTTLPGHREAAIRTQAHSMGQKMDQYENTWKNAAPSASYEAPMPNLSPSAKAARAALDPNYAKRLKVEEAHPGMILRNGPQGLGYYKVAK